MLLGLGNALRSLTTSPATAALQQAHRMAQRRLAAGGISGPVRPVDNDDDETDYVLPSDVDPALVAIAIAKLHAGRGAQAGLGDDLLNVLERRSGGRVVVPGFHLLRLGDGRYDLGRRFLHSLIGQIRACWGEQPERQLPKQFKSR
jgi:hypothetical protein